MKVVSRYTIICMALCFLITQNVVANEGAEVFDIQKGEVITTIDNSNSLQDQAKEWVNAAVSNIGTLHIEPSDGIAIKITLTPPYRVTNEYIAGTVTEVVMFISRSKVYFPTLLIFTKENGFVAVHVKTSSLKMFLKKNHVFDRGYNLTEPVHTMRTD